MSADGQPSPPDLAAFAKQAKSAMTKQLREAARASPGADIYEPRTLWDSKEKSKRTMGVRVSGGASGGNHEVRLDLWCRASGTPTAFTRSASAAPDWSELPADASGPVYQRGPVTLVADAEKGTITLTYAEERETPFSASSFRMYLGALFDELAGLAASTGTAAAEAPPSQPAPAEEGAGGPPPAAEAGAPSPEPPDADEPLTAEPVDDDDAPVAEILEFAEVDDFDEAEPAAEVSPGAAPESAAPGTDAVEEVPPLPPPPEPAAPPAYASPEDLLAALESGALKIHETGARTEIEGHGAEVAVSGEGRRKLIVVTVEGMPGLDAGTIAGCRMRLGDRTFSAKCDDDDGLVLEKKSPAPVPPPPAIREVLDYAAKFLQELAPKEPVAPAEMPSTDVPAPAPPPPPEDATPPEPPPEEPSPDAAPADSGIEVEEVSLDELLGTSEGEAPAPAEAASTESLPEPPPPKEEGEAGADAPAEGPEAKAEPTAADAASTESLPVPPPEEEGEAAPDVPADGLEEKAEPAAAPAAEAVEEEPQQPEEVPEEPFGDYKALRWIGRDVLGVLYEGKHAQTGSPAAIKVIDQEHTRNAKFAKDFVREGWTSSKLEHQGLNRLLTVGRTPQHVYFYASEFAEAKSARSVLQSGETFPVDDSKRIVRAISEALAYVHASKLYHGDVRPSYVLLTADGGVKLAEMVVPKNPLGCVDRLIQARGWGLADALRDEEGEARKEMEAVIRERRVVCYYLAPELADPRFRADGRADIYGLGATWYHMLTGSPPFADLPAFKLIMGEAGRSAPPEDVKPDVPQGVSAVIQKMMDPLPSERYQSMEEVVAAIDQL
ncbi:MAG: serine/threonine-protein kinase [Planctomycetota bacterium]|jgi:serine/threonine-protein kinase